MYHSLCGILFCFCVELVPEVCAKFLWADSCTTLPLPRRNVLTFSAIISIVAPRHSLLIADTNSRNRRHTVKPLSSCTSQALAKGGVCKCRTICVWLIHVFRCISLLSGIDWLIEHGFTSAPTQYRLCGRRFLQVWWHNQQCQSTEGGWLVIQTGLSLTMLTSPSPCYNTTTCMQILHKKII